MISHGLTLRKAHCIALVLGVLLPRAHAMAEGYGTITGSVVGGETRQPLASANIVIEGTKWGTQANEKGDFTLEQIPLGTYTVICRLLGYADRRMDNVVVEEGQTTRLSLVLVEQAIAMGEIQSTAERLRRLEDIRSSVLSLAPFRAKKLAGVAEDVMRTLQALPGVSSPNDFTSQLIVRGSGPDQNLIIMDDIEIFNPYRLYGVISMFNPETALDINLITGGFPARYGDRLSAVLDVTNREGDKTTPLNGSVNASITNANIVLSGRAPFGTDGSYVLSGRRTYYDLILGPIARNSGLVSGDVAFPNFGDVQYKFVLEPSRGHKVIATGVFSRDGVELVSGSKRETPDSINIMDDTRNDVVGFAWHYMPTPSFLSKLSLSWYRNRGISDFGGDFLDPSLNRDYYQQTGDTTDIRYFNVEFDSRYVFRKASMKLDLTWLLDGHTVEFGAGVDLLETEIVWHMRPDETFRAYLRSRGIASVDDFVQDRENERVNLYGQDKVQIGDKMTIQAGLRLDYYTIIRNAYLQPRLNILYRLNPLTSLRAAWGVYRQSPGYEKLFDQYAFYDLTNVSTSNLRAERATHYVIGVDRWIDNRWQLRAESYYKDFDNLVVQSYLPGTLYEASRIPGGDPRKPSGWTPPVGVIGDSLTTIPVNGATGAAYGVEVFLEKRNAEPGDRLSGWLSYSLSKAERVRDGIRTPFRFDQRHTVNLVLDYQLSSWFTLGIRWKYGSNFAVTPPIGIKPRVVAEVRDGKEVRTIATDSKGNVVFDLDRGTEANWYSGRLPAYHRLDLRATARADYWGLDWNFYLDVINVYNHGNLLNYRYYIKDDLTLGRGEITMFPILPTLGVSVRF